MSVLSDGAYDQVSASSNSPINGIIVISNAYIPNFKVDNNVTNTTIPTQLYQCSNSTVFALQNTTESYSAPVQYSMDIYAYLPDEGTRTLVHSSGWSTTPPTQLPNILLASSDYIIRWSVRSSCAKITDKGQYKEGWVFINGLPTAGALNFKFRRPNGATIGSLYNRNQTTPTAALPINAPLIGGVTAEVRTTNASGLIDIKPTIEVVNCNTGGPIIAGSALSTILCNPSFTQNVYVSANFNVGLRLNDMYIDADGLNNGSATVAQNYFTNLAASDYVGNTTILANKCFKITLQGKSPFCPSATVVTQWSYFRFQSKAGNALCPLCRTFDADSDIAAQYIGIDANSLHLYPNPAKDQINIGFIAKQEGKARIVLTDLTGRMVKEFFQTIIEGENTVSQSVTDLPNALYIYTVQAGSQNLSGKFIKQD
jgi:hypothetical protein